MAINNINKFRACKNSNWLFHTREGKPYIKPDGSANGFDSLWQRFMNKAIAETNLDIKFTEHDIRAKTASDIDLAHAHLLLGHSRSKTTNKYYRRKPEEIKPSK